MLPTLKTIVPAACLGLWLAAGGHTVAEAPATPATGSTAQTRADAYYHRGETRRKAWWLREAMADFNWAIQLDPTDARSHYGRGLVHEFTGYTDKAMADYAEAIRLAPDGPLPYIRRGGLHQARGQRDRAYADLNRGIALCDEKIASNPRDPQLFRARALAHSTRKQYDRAVADLTEMIRLDPGNVDGYTERGRAWAALGSTEAAMSDFDAAVRLSDEAARREPGDLRQALRQRAIARHARAFASKRSEDFEAALADFAQLATLMPDCPTLWFYTGQAHAGAEHYAGGPGRHFAPAVSAFDKVIQLDPAYAAAWHERGLLRMRRALGGQDAGQAEAAIADLSEMLRLVPDAARGYCDRGGAYAVARRFPEAQADLDRAIQLCPSLAEAYELRGRLRMALGQTSEAQADLTQAGQLQGRLF